MHAILGLSALDLAKKDASLMPLAMAHRIKAIKAVKKSVAAMSRRGTTHEEANALIATCFALSFQSVTFKDGMAEFMAFIRGIVVVGIQMWTKGIQPIFSNISGDDGAKVLEPLMADLPPIRREWTDSAVVSIENLRALCREEVEFEYQSVLLDMAQTLYTSSWEGEFSHLPPVDREQKERGKKKERKNHGTVH